MSMLEKPTYEALEQKVRELERALSKQKQVDAAPSESDLLFRELTVLSPGGIYRTDINGDCIYTNPAWLEMAGTTFEKAQGKGWIDSVHPDDRKGIVSAWYKMVASGGRWGHEYRFLSPRGKITWVYGLATPVYNKEQQISGYLGLNTDITALKEAEHALVVSNQRFQSLFHESPIPLWEEDFSALYAHFKALKESGVEDWRGFLDANPSEVLHCARMVKVINVNQAALQLHGAKSKADLLGNLEKIFTERSMKAFKEEVIALAEGRTSFETEGEVRTLSGRTRYIYLKLTIEKELDASISGRLATVDITERKHMELALRASEARLSAFLDHSPIGFGLWDAEFRYLYLNEELQKMNGPSIEAHLGKTIEEILPKAAPVIRHLFEKIMVTGEPILNLELSGETPSQPGKIRHFLVSYFPIQAGDGHPQFIGGVIVDVTERKLTEAALRASEEKYRELIELAQEGIWAIDKENNTRFVNPSMAKMLGYMPEEMLERPLFSFMDEQGVELAQSNLARRRQGIKEQHDFEFVRKDGQRVYTTMATAPILDDEGNYNGAIAGVIDITERRQVEEDRLKLQAHLAQSQKMESIGTLAGGIAHDFNNILTSVIGFTELSLDDVQKGSIMEDNLQEIYTASIRAKEMVKQILTFARQSDEAFKPIQMDIIVKEVLRLMRATIPSNIEIRQSIHSTALISGNVSQIHQVVMNLCSNAAHAMAHHGGTLEVKLKDILVEKKMTWESHVLEPGHYVEIVVSDTGPGIAGEIIDHIFEPYFTTKRPGEGTGMGLAMVNGIVENHGGKMAVDSTPGRGARFAIALPATAKRQISDPYRSEALPTGEEHILFVDDEASIARMNGMVLERLGYTVTTCTNSSEALSLFRSRPNDFDLVISDMTMPKMTGDLLAKAMLEIRPDIPIILCTGYSKRLSESHVRQLGISTLVYKPIVKADIAHTIRNILDAS